MKIDWFTIVAQAINFLVLLWLMKRFLYKPILKAIDEREKRIAEELSNAETNMHAAQKQKEEYDRKNEELDRQSAAYLKKAQDEGNAEKSRLLKDARETADALSRKRQESLVVEASTLRESVSRKIQSEVLAITGKVLAELAGVSLEERVVEVFIQRLRDLDTSEKMAMASALEKEPGKATVRTAFDLSPALRDTIETSIKEIFGSHIPITFESTPDLVSGIELAANGQKVAWNVADYLSSIEECFDDLLKENV